MLTASQNQLLEAAKQTALELGELGRALTSLIGELSACKLRGLKWVPHEGYDAVDSDGTRYQMKSRKPWETTHYLSGTLGAFDVKGRYDHGLLVELDDRFEVAAIWQCSKQTIESLVTRKDRQIVVGKFRANSTRVYPVKSGI